MAGQGFKDFTVGEVLTAADVDGYLMQQSVMRFADASARAAALGTAVLAEGMVSYLDDIDTVEMYSGSGWLPLAGGGTAAPSDGQILAYGTATGTWNPADQLAGIGSNVSSTVKTDTFSTTATATWQDVTGLSVTITPRFSTSKVLVFGAVSISQQVNFSTSTGRVMIRGLRGGTVLDVGDAAGSRTRSYTGSASGSNSVSAVPFLVLDSPATTSATTYKIQLFSSLSIGGVSHVNRSQTDADAPGDARTVSYLVAVEVAG